MEPEPDPLQEKIEQDTSREVEGFLRCSYYALRAARIRRSIARLEGLLGYGNNVVPIRRR
jgi:hypothetical protein